MPARSAMNLRAITPHNALHHVLFNHCHYDRYTDYLTKLIDVLISTEAMLVPTHSIIAFRTVKFVNTLNEG